jgi:hypothetical protein
MDRPASRASVPDGLQTSFCRALEEEYARRVAAYDAAGIGTGDAHERAFLEAKTLGTQVLNDLRCRGLDLVVSEDGE